MPSAQHREIEEPLVIPLDEQRADLPSILRALRPSNNGNLNSLHGRGKVLFAEGEPARGLYILRTGRATVSISSREGRVIMLRLAQPGDVLGLNSVLQNRPYDTTVKTLEPCRTDFLARSELIELQDQSHAIASTISELLSRELSELTERAKALLLPHTVNGRLAKLLLEWSKENGSATARVDRVLTHEEIAQMICSSRETVTRLLASLTKQQVIRVTTDSILICNRCALEHIAEGT